MVWAYVENGADGERTLRGNEDAFSQWRLRQRVLTGVGDVHLRTEVGGTRLALPVLLAPTGLAGAAHWSGDLGAARAAEERGTRLVLSSASTYSLEEVAQGTAESHWFQLYPWANRELIGSLVDRAQDSGYHTLVVTVDVPVYGNRLRERRVGMAIPPTITPRTAASALARPAWLYGLLKHQRISLKNLEPVAGKADPLASLAVQSANLTAGITWDDLTWLRRRWPGPLMVKGILDADDAERVADLGVDGVVVSNHGGRQLDGAPASLEALPVIAERVGHRIEVLLDGGIRTGADVVVARALGARACLIGRAMLYGLAGGGPEGVVHVLRILEEEMARTLALMGLGSIDEVTRESLIPARQAG
jgi:L-lactate dehydrogenase (cytochrome)/(S)-mandelate dehydrogenase